jgi:hypothetical protein
VELCLRRTLRLAAKVGISLWLFLVYSLDFVSDSFN